MVNENKTILNKKIMNNMKLWVLAGTLFCGLTLLTACGDDNDDPMTPPTPQEEQSQPKLKISKVYSANTVKAERKIAGQWTTLYEQTQERAQVYDFQWNDDRLARIVKNDATWVFTYDDQQRVVFAQIANTRFSYAYTYDAQGRLAQSVNTVPSTSTLDHVYTTTYIYSGGKLVKTVETGDFNGDTELPATAVANETTTYEWQGDNIASTTIEMEHLNGERTSETLVFEYIDQLNPFRDDMLLQTHVYYLLGYETGDACLSKNLLKSTTVGPSVSTYEYTIEGGRVVSIASNNTAESAAMRLNTHTEEDLEYY